MPLPGIGAVPTGGIHDELSKISRRDLTRRMRERAMNEYVVANADGTDFTVGRAVIDASQGGSVPITHVSVGDESRDIVRKAYQPTAEFFDPEPDFRAITREIARGG